MDDGEIEFFLFERGIIEKFSEGPESGVHVGEPQKKHLFNNDLPVRHPFRCSLEVGGYFRLSLPEVGAGKL